MALTIRDAMELTILQTFTLVGGRSGLNRQVKEVNILDFEYIDAPKEPMKPDGLFHPHALVLSSLLYAKNDPDKILPALKQMVTDGISAFAIKSVYFNRLPDEVMDYADEIGLPIFFFHGTDFENIIWEVTFAAKEQNKLSLLEEETERFLNDEMTKEDRNEAVNHLFPGLGIPYRSYYYAPRIQRSRMEYEHFISGIRRGGKAGWYFLPYKMGLLAVIEGSGKTGSSMIGFNEADYFCGSSPSHKNLETLPYALWESIYASEYAEQNQMAAADFDEMGIWQAILPNKDNYWMSSFSHMMVQKLKNHEPDGGCQLYRTLKLYAEHDFDAAETAKAMSLHKNSVRYRVNKAAELLGFEKDSLAFRQAVYFAFLFASVCKNH